MRKTGWTFLLLLAAVRVWAAQPTSLVEVINRINQQETQFAQNMRTYSPMVETYLQDMKPDAELGQVPSGDAYFLGRLNLSRGVITVDSFVRDHNSWLHRFFGSLTTMTYKPAGFAVVSPDENQLDSAHYEFAFVRREFLGNVRCLVFDVTPRNGTGQGRFIGRLWVEDQGYNIVRFNGTFAPRPRFGYYVHLDSWRLNVGPNLWLPAYTFSEETDLKYSMAHKHVSFKAQTRFWAYNVHSRGRQDELTQVVVEPAAVKDQSDNDRDLSPLESQRMWARQSEDNVLDKLERSGLLAPEGEVNKVLDTVVNNIAITNKLDLQPEIRCRVLLTAPMESFTVGHTIVMSRGLLDVLPDEATLATVLAHEMSHIVLAHGDNPMYGFNDKMFFPDSKTFVRLNLHHTPQQEQAADAKALELLKSSPYKDQLANAGLFLRALQQRAKGLEQEAARNQPPAPTPIPR